MKKMRFIILLLFLLKAVINLDMCKDWPKIIKGPSSAYTYTYSFDASLEHDLIITGGFS